jgi:hypothetical protein
MNSYQNYKKAKNSKVLDSSKTIEYKPINKIVMVQDWINNTQNENKIEDKLYVTKMIESWKYNNLQENVNNFKFPKIETINSMTLEQNLAYEAMLINILDKKPSDLIASVEILLHLKIISNNQMYKFKIFE